MAYVPRVVDAELDELLEGLAAVAIEGPKGVGKTVTASQRARTIRELDDAGQFAVAVADPGRLLTGERPVLIDEWQRYPAAWDLVRRAVDRGAAPGSFLLTGSASPEAGGTHSGAARIVSLRMRPLSLAERGLAAPTVSLGDLLTGARPAVAGSAAVGLGEYVQEIARSGLPGLRALSGRPLRTQLQGYVDRIIDRDFPELGLNLRDPAGLRRWMTAYAAAVSTTASYETIRDAATGGHGEKPAKTTVLPYRDVLERLWILEPLPAWSPQGRRISRLASAPKHQLADPAIAATLLGAGPEALLEGRSPGPAIPRDGTLLGQLFESLVTLSVRVYAQAAEAAVKHLRLARGEREVDLIVERADGRVLGVEVKLARHIGDDDVRHLRWLADRLGDELLDLVVVSTGAEAYRRPDGIAVVPAALLGP